MKFDVNVNNIVLRARNIANLIHKCFVSNDPPTLMKAFLVYVRPVLEYASCVWSPQSVGKSSLYSVDSQNVFHVVNI